MESQFKVGDRVLVQRPNTTRPLRARISLPFAGTVSGFVIGPDGLVEMYQVIAGGESESYSWGADWLSWMPDLTVATDVARWLDA